MKLDLTEVILDEETIDRSVPFELEGLRYSFGSFPITEKSPVRISIHKGDRNVLSIHGSTALIVAVPCDRCLEDVNVTFNLDFDELISESDTGADIVASEKRESFAGDLADTVEPFEPFYCLEGHFLDVDMLVKGEVLLNWPSKVLCAEDCKGLCPVCGHNLNQGECGCDRSAQGFRMSKVLDIFSKFAKEE